MVKMVRTCVLGAVLGLTCPPPYASAQEIGLGDILSAGQSIASNVFASSSTNLGALATAGESLMSALETATSSSTRATSSASSTRATSTTPTSLPSSSQSATTSLPSSSQSATTSMPISSTSSTTAAAASSSPSPATATPHTHNDRRLAIVLGTVLGALALLFFLLTLWLCLRRRRRHQHRNRRSTDSHTPLATPPNAYDHDAEKASSPATPLYDRPRSRSGGSMGAGHADWPWAGSTTRSTAQGGPTATHMSENTLPREGHNVPPPTKGMRRSMNRRSSTSMHTVSEEREGEAAEEDPFMGETRPERERRTSASGSLPRSARALRRDTRSISTNDERHLHPAHRSSYQALPQDSHHNADHKHNDYLHAHTNKGFGSPFSPAELHSHSDISSRTPSPLAELESPSLSHGTPSTYTTDPTTNPTSSTQTNTNASTSSPSHTQNVGIKRTPSYLARLPTLPLPRRSSKRNKPGHMRPVRLLSNEEAGGFQFGFPGGHGHDHEHEHEHEHEQTAYAGASEQTRLHALGPEPEHNAQREAQRETAKQSRSGAKSRGRGDYERVHGGDLGDGFIGSGYGHDEGDNGRRHSISRKPVPARIRRAGAVVGSA